MKHGYINCSTCHASPWGGGQRNAAGKMYGAHGFKPGLWSNQDLFSLDLRALALYPEQPATRQNGLGLMTVTPSANIPITRDTSSESSAVLGYGLGGLATGLREAYLVFQGLPATDQSALRHFVIGKFNAPFGLLSDEHRTFARQSTMTTNNEYEFGLAASGDPLRSFHYDLAVTNGFQTGGNLNGTDLPWAATLNVRHQPGALPFHLGWSGMVHRKIQLPWRPWAQSVWTVVSLDRSTNGILKGSLQGEAVVAHGWNDSSRNNYITRFVPAADTAWQTALNGEKSLAYYGMGTLDVSQRLALVYKYDQFTPAKRFSGDSFIRHSYGIRWIFNSNMQAIVRREESRAGRPGVTEQNSAAARDGFLAVFHAWL